MVRLNKNICIRCPSRIFLDLVIAISKAIHMIRYEEVDPSRFNDELKDMYSWSNVAERTEKVRMLKKETAAQHDSLWEGIVFPDKHHLLTLIIT